MFDQIWNQRPIKGQIHSKHKWRHWKLIEDDHWALIFKHRHLTLKNALYSFPLYYSAITLSRVNLSLKLLLQYYTYQKYQEQSLILLITFLANKLSSYSTICLSTEKSNLINSVNFIHWMVVDLPVLSWVFLIVLSLFILRYMFF